MKKLICLFLVGIVLVSCTPKKNSDTGTNLSPKAFKEAIESAPDGVVLDVRTPEEVENGVIKNANVIDFKSDNFESQVNELDKTKTYYVYCATGGRSGKAATMMIEKGFKVYALDGGMNAWKEKGLPVENLQK